MRRICIFTSTRAEWGLLRPVAAEVLQLDDIKLQIIASGTHLSEEHGMTVREIEEDGFSVDAQVDILQFDDSPLGICKSMGLALSGFGKALLELKPDLLVLLGDRYEAFCAAAVAQVQRVPVAHIHGGETTEGAIDEAFRHSITKMSHLHFPCCEEYRKRIIQLGESPERVFNVGALGVENIRKIDLMDRSELEASIGFVLDQPFFLVTFHPVTLEHDTAAEQLDRLLEALAEFPEYKLIFTRANADTDGHVVNDRINMFTATHPDRCLSIASLGLRRYLSALKLSSAVVGNSSSGILEAPALGVPTVNIGDRQKGRIRAPSILDCDSDADSIKGALGRALDPQFQKSIKNMILPYEQKDVAFQIVDQLRMVDLDRLLKKSFYNVDLISGLSEGAPS